MQFLKYIIPNGLTLLNLLCGSISVTLTFQDNPVWAAYLICAAAVFDLLDGLFAKLLNATSEFGKQLDSLADVVSFGLAPSILIYHLLIVSFTLQSENGTFLIETTTLGQKLLLYSSFTIGAAAALRLARFNIQESSGNDFVGMPVPAPAIFIAALLILFRETDSEVIQSAILNVYVIFGVIFILSFLMLSRLRMISFKMTSFSLRPNILRYILILGSLVLLIIYRLPGLVLIMVLYILLSIINSIVVMTSKESS